MCSAICKLHPLKVGARVAFNAIGILGGVGYNTGEYLVERIRRDVKPCEIGEQTSEIQRLVIEREMLKKLEAKT
jgi:alkylation response protein AidB-like acyl-CoA dehydrogenase